MQATIIEIKARCTDPKKIKTILKSLNADFKGIDHQVDTYFEVPNGRLKLREGNIENTLIHYLRPNQAGPKQSNVTFVKSHPDHSPKKVLTEALGVLTKVDKQRAIYFIDNVKFHVDEVKSLGNFMEIEAIDDSGMVKKDVLMEQCQHYLDLFGVLKTDLIEHSYSDMLISKVNAQ